MRLSFYLFFLASSLSDSSFFWCVSSVSLSFPGASSEFHLLLQLLLLPRFLHLSSLLSPSSDLPPSLLYVSCKHINPAPPTHSTCHHRYCFDSFTQAAPLFSSLSPSPYSLNQARCFSSLAVGGGLARSYRGRRSSMGKRRQVEVGWRAVSRAPPLPGTPPCCWPGRRALTGLWWCVDGGGVAAVGVGLGRVGRSRIALVLRCSHPCCRRPLRSL